MSETKKLRINAAACDISEVAEHTLAAYESIEINAALIVTSAQTQELLARHSVKLNASSVVTLPAGAQLSTKNGSVTIRAGERPAAPTALLVNGTLEIEAGAERALEGYVSIQVNGLVSAPQSMAERLARIQVNGSTELYPDGAVRLKRSFTPDRVFVLRARAAAYYAARRVVLLDPTLDLAALAAKGVRFLTRQALVAESLLEQAIPLFDETTEITLLPDGCVFVNDDAALNSALLRRYGERLYVSGDLSVAAPDADCIERLAFLEVNGDVTLPEELADRFCARNFRYQALKTYRGRRLNDRPLARVAAADLRDGPLTVEDCAVVQLAADLTPELIRTRLSIRDCAAVRCAPEQRGAVEEIARDVAAIRDSGGGLRDLLHARDSEDDGTETVNAAQYKL